MGPSPDPKSSPVPPVSGVKRRAVSLLPAFEPLSSSPALPRPLKRSRDAFEDSKYPTPLPTSSTAILSSSPSRANAHHPVSRVASGGSERAPLSDVRSIDLTDDGKMVLMGRSSVSSHFQLSANRLISRVHVKACYKPAKSSLKRDRVEIECSGWNGAKVHCFGKAHFLHKDEVFTSEDRHADIMVEVADARVMLRWPARKNGASDSEDTASGYGDENSPGKSLSPAHRRSFIAGSPLRQRQRIASPVSPSPAAQAALAPSSPFLPQPPSSPPPVEIYEDSESAEEGAPVTNVTATQQSTQAITQPSQADLHGHIQDSSQQKATQSLQSSLTEPPEDFSDHDEENDPIIHSFGPFGANLTASMESFKTHDSPRIAQTNTHSPVVPKQTASPPEDPPQPPSDMSHIQSHIVNQLAFSRLSSTPISTIISHLPLDTPAHLKDSRLVRDLIHSTTCIGEVTREGKDAAGKPLESEYYYIPEGDEDEGRKAAVVEGLGRTGLRNCRKQHKVSLLLPKSDY